MVTPRAPGEALVDKMPLLIARLRGHAADLEREAWDEDHAAAADCRAAVDALALRPSARDGECERQWPDIGTDPLKGPRPDDRYAASAAACREAYVRQQEHVPDQTALVWRWHLGALLEEHLRLQAILSRKSATLSADRSDPAGEVGRG